MVFGFNATFDRGDLYVGAQVYDVTDGGQTPVGSIISMTNLTGNNIYFAEFNRDVTKQYLISKSVYTDPERTILDSNYYQLSESINPPDSGGGGSGDAVGCAIVGYVTTDQAIVGYVNCA